MLELGIRFFCIDLISYIVCVCGICIFVCACLYISVLASEVNTGCPQSLSTLVSKIGGTFY